MIRSGDFYDKIIQLMITSHINRQREGILAEKYDDPSVDDVSIKFDNLLLRSPEINKNQIEHR